GLICSFCPICSALGLALDHSSSLFFFIAPPPTPISPLSLHDALPIFDGAARRAEPATLDDHRDPRVPGRSHATRPAHGARPRPRSEEHTSELQSLAYLVCRLLLEKKKKHRNNNDI